MTVSKIRLNGTDHDIRAKYLIQSSSADAVSAEFSARTVTDDAIANIQKIYGNTIKWNQIANLSQVMAYNGASISASGTTGIWTVTATGRNQGLTVKIGPATINHKYYVSYYVKTTTATDFRIASYNNAGYGSEVSINGIGYVDAILTQVATVTDQRFMCVVRTSSYSGTFDMGLPMVVDLTDIYGSGNEPTITAFKADFPYDYYPYTTLTLLSNSATAIQSKDSSDNVIGNCDLNIPTLTGKLNGAGSSVVIFPNGMQSNGTTRDELTATSAIKKIADDNSVLSTPQTYILDNALQLQYPVVAGGTEMVLPTSGTAPMKMDVIYGNAADAAATMSQNFISVDSMKEFLDKLGTQMNGTWAMQYSGGKYTFTFTSN